LYFFSFELFVVLDEKVPYISDAIHRLEEIEEEFRRYYIGEFVADINEKLEESGSSTIKSIWHITFLNNLVSF
jgi:hypothetical protein